VRGAGHRDVHRLPARLYDDHGGPYDDAGADDHEAGATTAADPDDDGGHHHDLGAGTAPVEVGAEVDHDDQAVEAPDAGVLDDGRANAIEDGAAPRHRVSWEHLTAGGLGLLVGLVLGRYRRRRWSRLTLVVEHGDEAGGRDRMATADGNPDDESAP
jgi:hypothetical protein